MKDCCDTGEKKSKAKSVWNWIVVALILMMLIGVFVQWMVVG